MRAGHALQCLDSAVKRKLLAVLGPEAELPGPDPAHQSYLSLIHFNGT